MKSFELHHSMLGKPRVPPPDHRSLATQLFSCEVFVTKPMRTIDERGMLAVMDEAVATATKRGGHLHVSFDVDFVDPTIAPGVGTTVYGGPTHRESQLAMEMIYDSDLLASLDIMELNPALDLRNQTAELVVELVASLFGEQILSRHKTSFS